MSQDAKYLGEALRRAREGAKLSQEEAAKRAGLSVTRVTVANYERGLLPEGFYPDTLEKLASAYNTTSEALLTNAEKLSKLGDGESLRKDEPIVREADRLTPPVREWLFRYLGELTALHGRAEIESAAIESAQRRLTFRDLEFWAGRELNPADERATFAALRWAAMVAWRNIVQPGWLDLDKKKLQALPEIFSQTPSNLSPGPRRPLKKVNLPH